MFFYVDSLLCDGQCGCTAAYLNLITYIVVDKGVDVRLLMYSRMMSVSKYNTGKRG